MRRALARALGEVQVDAARRALLERPLRAVLYPAPGEPSPLDEPAGIAEVGGGGVVEVESFEAWPMPRRLCAAARPVPDSFANS